MPGSQHTPGGLCRTLQPNTHTRTRLGLYQCQVQKRRLCLTYLWLTMGYTHERKAVISIEYTFCKHVCKIMQLRS